jgi:hypothetical protein
VDASLREAGPLEGDEAPFCHAVLEIERGGSACSSRAQRSCSRRRPPNLLFFEESTSSASLQPICTSLTSTL